MNDKMVTQIDLVSGDKRLTTWVDADPRVRVGANISIKGMDGRWDITHIYATQDAKSIDKRGWDNNNYDKHVGLQYAK